MEQTSAANASTGGVHTSGGTTVTGDSSASVQVTNVINAGNEGGTSHTVIEKTVDGVTTVTEETKNFAPGERVQVNVTAEAHSSGTSETGTTSESATGETSTVEAGEASSTPTEAGGGWSFTSYIMNAVSNLFEGFLSWFSR